MLMLWGRMDLALLITILSLFTIWCTVHIALCLKLMGTSLPKALLSFVIPPLAPYFGQAFEVKRLPTFWVASASLYFLALVAGML